MSKLLFVLMTSILLSGGVIASEKGGSGTGEDEVLILENFKIYGVCPEKNAVKLCSRLVEEKASKPSLGFLSQEKENEEEFLKVCCQDLVSDDSPVM